MESKAVKVSIIICVYNEGRYLEHCLQNIQEQTLKEFEIILIDCGSNDESVSILQKYVDTDKRFRFFRQKYKGKGFARNFGIVNARGQYILFLEPDSFFSSVMLERAYYKALYTRADIVVFDGINFLNDTGEFEQGNFLNLSCWGEKKIISRLDIPEKIFSITNPSPCTKLYRKKFILKEGIWYQELPDNNEIFFLFISDCVAERIAYVDQKLIYYRIKDNTGSKAEKNPLTFITAYLAIYEELRRRGIYSDVEKAFINMAVNDFSYNLNMMKDTYARNLICEKLMSPELEATEILKKPLDFYISNVHIINILGILNGYRFAKKQKVICKNVKLKTIVTNQLDAVPVVSVIIPVYNVENYVKDALDSIRNQSLRNIEIICINDGSTDSSLAILKNSAEEDKRISLYSQTNKGPSITRNKGIEKARGKYLYFMDSDDILEKPALEILSTRMENDQLDVIYFDGSSFSTDLDENDERVKKFQTYYRRYGDYNGIYSGLEMLSLMLKHDEFRVQPCLQMIRREYLQGVKIMFHPGILHEDNAFTFLCMAEAKRTGYCPLPFFKRRVRLGSIMMSEQNFNNAYGYFCCYRDILRWVNERELDLKDYETVEWMLKNMKEFVKRKYKDLDDIEKGTLSGLSCGEQEMFRQLCE